MAEETPVPAPANRMAPPASTSTSSSNCASSSSSYSSSDPHSAPPREHMQLYTATERSTEGDLVVSMHLLIGDGCCFLWVGEASKAPAMGSLCVATMTPYDNLPVSSTLLRDAPDNDQCQSMAHRLAKRTGQQVFVSCSMPASPTHLPLLAALEKRAYDVLTGPN